MGRRSRGAMLLPSPCARNATAPWPPGGSPTAGGAGSGPGPGAVAAGCLLSLLVAWTLLGNGLVCAAIVGCRRLRAKVTTIFVASLAVSDLLVAVLVMPWKAAAEVAGRWPFGGAFCRAWVAFDIMCSTASILNLCVISLDRYWAISSPFRYERKMTPRLALAMVGLAWALALLVSFLPVQLDWHRGPDGTAASGNASHDAPAPRCDASLNRTYAVSSSLISFYIPVAVMLVTYSRIYRIAQGQIRRISSLERAAERAQSCRGSPRPAGAPSTPLRASLRQEARVLKTLALVVGVFVCCWLPFFVLNCLVPFCGRPPCVSDATFDAFVWVGWANSSVNPIIYACNADFRKVFAGLLGCGHRRAPAALETGNLSHELLSGPHPPLPGPRRLPSACLGGSPVTLFKEQFKDSVLCIITLEPTPLRTVEFSSE
uniref:D(1B) dopamine receptor n=1 Tax=Sphaerodactylus townsendi TaxID=933632 RepID=A0ACB8E6V6_9SAUR